ncbi:N-acetyl-alpha-D-glucosaminyl L-malate synthase [bacterium HR33]|nr:N-acetyl-alpha-D-glucosaminyl L-malate synthase [bacterium HR33]
MIGAGALKVTAIAATAGLGGTERLLLDLAARAFEYDIALRLLVPQSGPLVTILNEIGVPAEVVAAPEAMLAGPVESAPLLTGGASLLGVMGWARRLAVHPFWQETDLVYTVAFKAHLACALRRKHPVVWHLHEMPPERMGAAWRAMARRLADGLIAPSRAAAEAWTVREPDSKDAAVASRFGLPVSKPPELEVIPSGVDLDRFRPRERSYWIHRRLGLDPSARLLGTPVSFTRWKGALEAIRAFSSIAGRHPVAHLLVSGPAPYETGVDPKFREEVEAAVRSAGSRVHLFSFEPKAELVYPELDLVLHYPVRPEAFGRVLVEAMACAVPVIAAAEGGALEVLDRGGGWLVRPRDWEALASALEDFLKLPAEERRRMGEAGRRAAEDRYSARVFAREVARVLRRVAGSGAQPG